MKKLLITIAISLSFASLSLAAKENNEEEEIKESLSWEIPLPDTGDQGTSRLGWINTSKFPYVWSYNLNSWLYMLGEVENIEDATWVYVFK